MFICISVAGAPMLAAFCQTINAVARLTVAAIAAILTTTAAKADGFFDGAERLARCKCLHLELGVDINADLRKGSTFRSGQPAK